jgi:hypothetical protein
LPEEITAPAMGIGRVADGRIASTQSRIRRAVIYFNRLVEHAGAAVVGDHRWTAAVASRDTE